MDKKEIRKEIILKRDKIEEKDKKEFDRKIKDILKSSDYYRKAKNIFIYIGFGSEINTAEYINEFLEEGKNIFLPRIDLSKKVMDAVEIHSLEDLKKNKFGILEPGKDEAVIDKNLLDLIIVPGVAFDLWGGRVGYGGGYYDKYMSDIDESIHRLALCYQFQVLKELPKEKHDIKINEIITENGLIIV
ncbi:MULTISPECIES: 5-formyltetrahydrofolate cyclo-ligase [Clostridium]|uniref:5-formyltetrahydrofolate cyclo-ligase n=1 Tax=Clostridium cibarium TaxID=2762247 RepID=A0ABR8PUT7_9CLOT|nr:5-formyltetrahydrofolate cyclo-ligase [Clostridium sp. HBUAS56017]MBD7911936.1 5-formyltetrahydrofolate cyclo-ligase [Clostridium cibarium]